MRTYIYIYVHVYICYKYYTIIVNNINKTKFKVERYYLTCFMCSINFIFKMLMIQ